MSRLQARALDETTWPDFARLVERHNGVWGGCWCMGFHAEGVGAARQRSRTGPRRRPASARAGRTPRWCTTATTCVGWCQFGPTDELPRIKRKRAYLDGLEALPDWRITCFFVDTSTGGTGSPPPRSVAP